MTARRLPNILVTGTPGVGKSLMSELLAGKTGLSWLEVSKFAKDNGYIDYHDDEYRCLVLDEDKLLDAMEPIMQQGGQIVDYLSAEMFPERWFDIVFVLRTNNTLLYDRLTARGYADKKLEDNVTCEIFMTILEEAKRSYDKNIVHELQSDTLQQLEANIDRICWWIEQWKIDNQ